MMNETEASSVVSTRGLAVALVSISRYLATQKPDFGLFLRASADHAAAAGVPSADLAFVELLIKSMR